MLEICRTIGDREGEADALSRLATTMARLFRVEEAQKYSAMAAELYRRLGQRQGEAAVVLNAGMLVVNLGHFAEGIELFRRAETLFASMDDLRGLAISALNQSAAAIYHEDFVQAGNAAAQPWPTGRWRGWRPLDSRRRLPAGRPAR